MTRSVMLMACVATLSANASRLDAVTFDTPLDVSTGITDLGDPSHPILARHDGAWVLVTVESGDVVVRTSTGGGAWSSPDPITSGVAAADPIVASAGAALHVAWQDDRSGHSEAYTRRLVGGVWSAEECLTCDGVASTSASLAGDDSGLAYAVWADAETVAMVRGRLYDGSWQAIQDLSDGTQPASAPSLSAGEAPDPPNPLAFTLAWVETLAPTVYALHSGGYVPSSATLDTDPRTAFVQEKPELAVAGNGVFLSDDGELFWIGVFGGPGGDGTLLETGTSPSAARNHFTHFWPEFAADLQERYYSAWADDAGGGLNRLHLEALEVSATALTPLFVSAWSGDFPDDVAGEIMLAWVDDVSGTPTLRTQFGTHPSCTRVEFQGAPVLLLAPTGTPSNTVNAVNVCSGEGLPGSLTFPLEMSQSLEDALTWDPGQERPPILLEADPDGQVTFGIKGGGCSQAGTAEVGGNGIVFPIVWPGAKSPDVDGNCLVDEMDHDYVAAHMGTDDFCADLDGSGLVDAEDVAIVEATLGDQCPATVSIDQVTTPGRGIVRSIPNPAYQSSRILIEVSGVEDVDVKIWDASGRLVRSLGRTPIEAGRRGLTWDLRDDAGRLVASGAYFVRVTSGDESLTARVRVLR